MFDDQVEFERVFSENEVTSIRNEYSHVKDTCYLDHTGCPPYPISLVKNCFENLSSNLYGNPHSGNLSSKLCLDTVDQVRYRILQHFNTTSNEFSVIFTSGATASLKLVAESFIWTEKENDCKKDNFIRGGKSLYVYMEDNHTSVLGMREMVEEKGAEVVHLQHDEAFDLFQRAPSRTEGKSHNNSLFVYSAQSNFSGVKYPLHWIDKVHSGSLDNICKAKSGKSNWSCLLDAATYVSTNNLDLSSVKPDFVALSFYKMFGFPTGLGALLVRNSSSHLLKKAYYGGGTVFVAYSQENSYVPRSVLHERFEDGTINFLSIISLAQCFDYIDKTFVPEKLSRHCFALARYAYYCLSRLHHSNGAPAAVIYADTTYNDIKTQGNIVNFNLLRPNGEYIGYAEVLNLANLHGIHLRTGCFCNPGACRRHLNLSTADVKKYYMSGHVCGDDNDLIDGQPTGSVRISFGPYTTEEDVNKLLRMVVDCFVQKPILQRFPVDWNLKKEKLCRKFDLQKSEKIYIEEMLKSMCHIYFWLENVGSDVLYLHNNETEIINKSLSAYKEPNRQLNRCRAVHLSHLFLYPIKSCGKVSVDTWELSTTGLKYDREWMITNHAGVALTQKTEPRLCLIKPLIDFERQKLVLTFRDYPKFSIDLEGKSDGGRREEVWLCSSKVCGDEIRGEDCGDAVSLWLSHVLQRDGLRLVRQRARDSKSSGALSLSNQAQYLMINKTSVDWLTNKLEDNTDCNKESMLDRFRSNFVISGLSLPFEEQFWKNVKIGNQDFQVDGPCGRCQMICIDQESGQKTKEPLTTLAASFKGRLKFGIYLSLKGTSLTSLSVGDSISYEVDKEIKPLA